MAVKRSTLVWGGTAALTALFVAAYIDGGEEPVRPITVDVELPDGTL